MKINNETKIGILVVVVAIILGVITWNAGDYDFTPKGYELKVQFQNIDGIEENAPVTLNGLEVGRVSDIEILYGDATRVELRLWMKSNAKLHEGAKAYVKNMGFLGEKYVALTTGEDGTPFLPPGSIIQGQDPGSFDKILGDGEEIAKNIKEISEQVNERLRVNSEAIDNIVINLDTTMKNIASISTNVNERLEANEAVVDEMVANLNTASKNLDEMSYDLKLNPWKLLYKPKRERTKK